MIDAARSAEDWLSRTKAAAFRKRFARYLASLESKGVDHGCPTSV